MSVSQPGSVPPVPEPFWHRSWHTLWTWRPACIHGQCLVNGEERLFLNVGAWEQHYLIKHLGACPLCGHPVEWHASGGGRCRQRTHDGVRCECVPTDSASGQDAAGGPMNEVELARNSVPVTLQGEWTQVAVNGWIVGYLRDPHDAAAVAERAVHDPSREGSSPSIHR